MLCKPWYLEAGLIVKEKGESEGIEEEEGGKRSGSKREGMDTLRMLMILRIHVGVDSPPVSLQLCKFLQYHCNYSHFIKRNKEKRGKERKKG